MSRACSLGLWTLLLLAGPAAAQPKPPRLDASGDPLPPGALLRIGSQRLQTGAVIDDLTFSHDGKRIVAATRSMGVYVWDVATAKELHHLPPLPPSRFEIEPQSINERLVGRVVAPGGRHVVEVDRKSILSLREVATGRMIIAPESSALGVSAHRAEFSPNGKTLALMHFRYGGRISLREVASGKYLISQPGVRLSPGGTHVAEVTKLGLVRLRAVASGREIRFDRKPWEVARGVAFAPAGDTLAILDPATSVVHLYEVATGKLLQSQAFQVAYNAGQVVLAVAADGRTVTLASLGETVYLYDAKHGKRFVRRALGRDGIYSFERGTFSPDGKLLAMNTYYHVHVLEVATGKNVDIKVECHGLRFSADGRRLVVLANPYKGVVKVFETATGRLVQTSTEGGALNRLAVSPDGKYLAGADVATVRLWHADTGKPLHDFANPRAVHLTVQFAPDGKTIASLGHPPIDTPATACVWDAVSGKPLQRFAWATGAISADGRVLARIRADQKLLVTEVPTQKLLMQVDAATHTRSGLLLSPDGKFLLASCWDHLHRSNSLFATHLWDVAGGKKLLETEWRAGGYHHGYLDGSGRILMVVWVPYGKSDLTHVTCYDLATGRKLPRGALTLLTSRDTFDQGRYQPMISPDGRLLAEAPTYGGPVQLRELATGQLAGGLPDRGYTVSSSRANRFSKNDRVAFSPNGRLLAAVTTAGVILVWDMATSAVVAEVRAHRGAAASLSWSPDGKRLVSSGQDMTLLVWDAAPWWARVEKAPQSLTAQQLEALWQQLASSKADQGFDAVRQLVRAPKQAVTLLRKHLAPARPTEVAQVRALLADLNSDRFAVRQQAQARLEALGELALPALENAQAGSPGLEVRRRVENLLHRLERTSRTAPPAAAWLQQTRALSVLTTVATAEAKTMLRELAAGEPEAWRTREARLILARWRQGAPR